MGAGNTKGIVVVSKRQYRYELESSRGGYGSLLEKQKGQRYEGFFLKKQHQSHITPQGLVFMIRNQAKRQVYSGFLKDEDHSTGQMLYSGQNQNPDYYIGTQNQYTRDGFGEYSESGVWSYIGFWLNGKMNGMGRLTHIQARESFTGIFQDGQIVGWGQYEKVKANKVLKPKGSKMALQGTEYKMIWSDFHPVSDSDSKQNKNKIIKTEDSNGSYLAFPRLEEIFFDARHTTRYILQMCATYDGELVNIRRRGHDTYEVEYLNKMRPNQTITRREVQQIEAREQFYTNCTQLLGDQFDPNFTFNDINYVVEKVHFIGGTKCRYLVSSDVEDQGGLTSRYSIKMGGDSILRYVAKGYIVSNQMEINSHRHELKMCKLANTKNLSPQLGICHREGPQEDMILNYHIIDQMHMQSKGQSFPKKYMILTKQLTGGEFLDAILGFREMKKIKILKPFERLILIRKILEAFSTLQALGIYHGQIYPSHIYIEGLYREENIDDCRIKLIDFSEAVYTKHDKKEYPSRFEAALLRDPQEASRYPLKRCYVHRHHRCPKQFRMFQHPLFSYYASSHQDISLGKLFYDIRATDNYSLIVNILILLAPSLQTEESIKKKLEEHAMEYSQSYAMNVPVNSLSRRKSFLQKQNVSVIQDILTSTYSNNSEVTLQINHLVSTLISKMESCTPDIRTRTTYSEQVLNFDDLKQNCKDDLGHLIAHFREHEFKVRRGRERAFGDDQDVQENLHRIIANRIFGALVAKKSIEEIKEQKRQKKESIFDRFFGEEWKRPDAEEEQKQGVVDASFITHPNQKTNKYGLPRLDSPSGLVYQNSETFSADVSIVDDTGIQRGRALTKKLNFPVNIIKEEEYGSDRGVALKKALDAQEVAKSPDRVRGTMAVVRSNSRDSPDDWQQVRRYTKTKKGYMGMGANDEKESSPPSKYVQPRQDGSQELLMIHNVRKHSPRQNIDQMLSPKRNFPFADADKYGDTIFGSTRDMKIKEELDENDYTDGDEDL